MYDWFPHRVHSEHPRLRTWLHCCDWYCPWLHPSALHAEHTVSAVALHAEPRNCPSPHICVHGRHTASLVPLQALLRYSHGRHSVQALHTALLVAPHARCMYAPGGHEALHAPHTVSFTLLHADTWYCPAPQALHSLHTVSSM